MSTTPLTPGHLPLLEWRLGAQEAKGWEGRELLQPGAEVRLPDETWRPIPRSLFYPWMQQIALRLLRRYAATWSISEDHLQWLVTGVEMISSGAEIPEATEENTDMRGQWLMMMATLNTLSIMVNTNTHLANQCVDLIKEIIHWASKRQRGDRRYPHSTASLATKAITLHKELDEICQPLSLTRQEQEEQLHTWLTLFQASR